MVQMEMETIQRASVLSRMHDYVFGVAELIPVRSVLKVAGLVSVLGVVKATLEYVGVDKDTLDLLLMHGPAIAQGAVGGIGAVLASHIAFTDDVSHEEKKRRWNVIQEMMEKRSFEKNQDYVGEVVSVIVERYEEPKISEKMLEMPELIQEKLKAMPGYCYGNSREMKLVRFQGDKDLVGTIVNVKVARADKWLLEGQLV